MWIYFSHKRDCVVHWPSFGSVPSVRPRVIYTHAINLLRRYCIQGRPTFVLLIHPQKGFAGTKLLRHSLALFLSMLISMCINLVFMINSFSKHMYIHNIFIFLYLYVHVYMNACVSDCGEEWQKSVWNWTFCFLFRESKHNHTFSIHSQYLVLCSAMRTKIRSIINCESRQVP